MKVPNEIIELARKYITHGDVQKIADISGLKRYDIEKVFDIDINSKPEAIAAVAAYYKEKESILSDYLK